MHWGVTFVRDDHDWKLKRWWISWTLFIQSRLGGTLKIKFVGDLQRVSF